MLAELVKQIIETQQKTGNNVTWEINQVINKLSPNDVLTLAPVFDEWSGTDDFTPRVKKNLDDPKFMPILKRSLYSMVEDYVRKARG